MIKLWWKEMGTVEKVLTVTIAVLISICVISQVAIIKYGILLP